VTAREVVARIQQKLASQGIEWREGGRDTFKAGKPETEVRGIATSGMSTFDVLRRASAAGKNLVISHEPTFYNDRDVTTDLTADPVYLAKQRFIADHDLVVWRFHDHAHAMRPDPLVAGSARALGWTQYASPTEPRIYILPATTLGQLATDVARRLGDRAIRIVGDPGMKVSRIVLGPGYGIPALTPDVDVSVGGEIGESGGNTEYALDAVSAGQPKGMIMLGHMMSEDHGMQEVAEWLRAFLADVPIAFIPAGEPFSSASALLRQRAPDLARD
jgi:putative NIF3 family GTP cyclohydrolase 1 type 2